MTIAIQDCFQLLYGITQERLIQRRSGKFRITSIQLEETIWKISDTISNLNIVHKSAFRMPRHSRQLGNQRCIPRASYGRSTEGVPFDLIFLRPPPLLVFEHTRLEEKVLSLVYLT